MLELVHPTGGYSGWISVPGVIIPDRDAVPGFPAYMCHHLDQVVTYALVGAIPDIPLFDGHDGTSYESMLSTRWTDIVNTDNSYSPLEDAIIYGGGADTFFRVIPKNAASLVRLSKEKPYYLEAMNGRLIYMGHDIPMSPVERITTDSGHGYSYRALPLDAFHQFHGASAFKILGFGPDSEPILTFYDSPTTRTYLLDERLKDLRDAIAAGDVSTGRAYGFNWVTSTLTSLVLDTQLEYTGQHIIKATLSTRYKVAALIGSAYAEIDEVTSLIISMQVIGHPIEALDVGVWHPITVLCTVKLESRYENFHSSNGVFYASWNDLTTQSGFEHYDVGVFDGLIIGSLNKVSTENLPAIIKTISTIRDNWTQWLKKHRGTFYCHSFYATADAVVKYGAGADLNLLEFFSEWSSWLDMPSMDYIRTLGRFDFRSRNWPRLVKSLLDVLSDVKLWYSFGARPNADIVLSGIETLEAELQGESGPELMGWKTLYGRKSLDLPMDGKLHHDFLKSCSIESNSKIRVRFDPGSYAVAALSLRQAGIAPTLSNIWDCLRWTWLLDMVFNIGDKLGAVDNATVLLALPNGVNTHSNRLRAEPDVSVLTDLGVILSEPLELWCLNRKVSLLLPALRDAEVDFSPPHGIDWATVGSFLWKISGLSTGL